jgi:hypothetical protein
VRGDVPTFHRAAHHDGCEPTPVGKVLFHGTPITEAINIVHTNEISTGANWRGEGDRVPLSRSFAVAYRFGEATDFSDFPTVFVLDWPKLAANYQIIPHSDVDANGDPWPTDEQEEAVYGRIRPLSRYLVSINIQPKILRAAMNEPELLGWMVDERSYTKSIQGAKNMMLRFARHPKLNVWHP